MVRVLAQEDRRRAARPGTVRRTEELAAWPPGRLPAPSAVLALQGRAGNRATSVMLESRVTASPTPPAVGLQRVKQARTAKTAANRRFGVNAMGMGIRRRRAPQRFAPALSGRVRIVSFKVGVGRAARSMRGLHPGATYLRRVQITYQGSRSADFRESNRVAGLAGTPRGYVWHHFHNYNAVTNQGTMYLMPVGAHARYHVGGVAQYEAAKRVRYGA